MKTNKFLLIIAFSFVLSQVNAQYSLPALPYSYDALMPYIDSTTMRIHYNNHHKAYVNNLNAAIEKHTELKNKTLEELIGNIAQLPADVQTAVRNNGGGHYNHSLFWTLMTPKSTLPNAPSDALKKAINDNFGSMDAFMAEFEKAASGRFGSGWAWLIVLPDGKLAVTSTPNQDNPLMQEAPTKGFPILGLDVWEHAYYLKYNSNRANYIKAFWNVVNWNKVNKLYNSI